MTRQDDGGGVVAAVVESVVVVVITMMVVMMILLQQIKDACLMENNTVALCSALLLTVQFQFLTLHYDENYDGEWIMIAGLQPANVSQISPHTGVMTASDARGETCGGIFRFPTSSFPSSSSASPYSMP